MAVYKESSNFGSVLRAVERAFIKDDGASFAIVNTPERETASTLLQDKLLQIAMDRRLRTCIIHCINGICVIWFHIIAKDNLEEQLKMVREEEAKAQAEEAERADKKARRRWFH